MQFSYTIKYCILIFPKLCIYMKVTQKPLVVLRLLTCPLKITCQRKSFSKKASDEAAEEAPVLCRTHHPDMVNNLRRYIKMLSPKRYKHHFTVSFYSFSR